MNKSPEIAQFQDDPQRTMDYLKRVKHNAHQKKLSDSKKESGYRRLGVWVHEKDIKKLKKKYPSQKGSIEWDLIIEQVLKNG